MGGCRCSYKSCARATKNSEKDFHFFHYPVKDADRCSKWINNARKPNFFNLPEDQLRNKVVCQLHFEQAYFTNAYRKRLIHNAVPTIDAGSEDPPLIEEINLQVLQSDSEGNVYTVDTDNLMQSEIGDVTSYVIQNGNLIPADQPNNDILSPTVYKFSLSDRIGDVEEVGEQGFAGTNVNYNNFSSKVMKTYSNDKRIISPIYQPTDPLDLNIPDAVVDLTAGENDYTEPTLLLANEKVEDGNNTAKVVDLSKTIEEHGKQIAHLRRILRRKTKKSRFRKRLTNTQVINSLRGIIPTTLHAAVSLHLHNKEDNFTIDEQNFLTGLYKASPAAYEMLLKDCKWKLPSADTVKKLISNRNGVR